MTTHRFRAIGAAGEELSFPDVADLVSAVHDGTVHPETMLFDGRANRWSRADEHDAVRAALAGDRTSARGGASVPPAAAWTRPVAAPAPGASNTATATGAAQAPVVTPPPPAFAALTPSALPATAAEPSVSIVPLVDAEAERWALWIGPRWEEHYRKAITLIENLERNPGLAKRLEKQKPFWRRWSPVWNWAALLPTWWVYRRLYGWFAVWCGLDLLFVLAERLTVAESGSVPTPLLTVEVMAFLATGFLGDYAVHGRGRSFFQRAGSSPDVASIVVHGRPNVAAAWLSVPVFVVWIALLMEISPG